MKLIKLTVLASLLFSSLIMFTSCEPDAELKKLSEATVKNLKSSATASKGVTSNLKESVKAASALNSKLNSVKQTMDKINQKSKKK